MELLDVSKDSQTPCDVHDMETQASPIIIMKQNDLRIVIDNTIDDNSNPPLFSRMKEPVDYIGVLIDKIKQCSRKKPMIKNLWEFFSCHSCRTLLENKLLVRCSTTECSRYFCLRCLNLKFNISYEGIHHILQLGNWECFSCQGICNCKICKDLSYNQTAAANFVPATNSRSSRSTIPKTDFLLLFPATRQKASVTKAQVKKPANEPKAEKKEKTEKKEKPGKLEKIENSEKTKKEKKTGKKANKIPVPQPPTQIIIPEAKKEEMETEKVVEKEIEKIEEEKDEKVQAQGEGQVQVEVEVEEKENNNTKNENNENNEDQKQIELPANSVVLEEPKITPVSENLIAVPSRLRSKMFAKSKLREFRKGLAEVISEEEEENKENNKPEEKAFSEIPTQTQTQGQMKVEETIQSQPTEIKNDNKNELSLSKEMKKLQRGLKKKRKAEECHFCGSLIQGEIPIAICSVDKCKKGYCEICIHQNFQQDFNFKNYNPDYWICYRCAGVCKCEKCSKKRMTGFKPLKEDFIQPSDWKRLVNKSANKKRQKFYDPINEDEYMVYFHDHVDLDEIEEEEAEEKVDQENQPELQQKGEKDKEIDEDYEIFSIGLLQRKKQRLNPELLQKFELKST